MTKKFDENDTVKSNNDSNSTLPKISTLGMAGTTLDAIFVAMISLDVLAKNKAGLNEIGLILGIVYIAIQTYTTSFNYYMDCFYKNESLNPEKKKPTKTGMKKSALMLLTIIFGVFSAVCFFLAEISAGIVLYDFNFLRFKYGIYLTYVFSVISALIYSIGSVVRIIWNLSKFDDRLIEKQQNKIDKAFQVTQKSRWILSPINFGFLLYKSFSWSGFILGVLLTIIDVYDNSIFLDSCDRRQKVHKFETKEAFYWFMIRYLLAIGFTICYSFATVYLKLIYFTQTFLGTPTIFNIFFSVVTATCGAASGIIYRYKTFQNIKAKINIISADEKSYNAVILNESMGKEENYCKSIA